MGHVFSQIPPQVQVSAQLPLARQTFWPGRQHAPPQVMPGHGAEVVVVVVVVVVGRAVVVVVAPVSVPGEQVPGGRQRELVTVPVIGLV